MAKDWSYEELRERAGHDEDKIVTVALSRGDTAWNPTSTKPENVLRGPAVVDYRFLRSGVTATVR